VANFLSAAAYGVAAPDEIQKFGFNQSGANVDYLRDIGGGRRLQLTSAARHAI